MFKPSAIALALSIALFAAPQQAAENAKIDLPEMGDSSGSLLTAQEEKDLGEEFFRYLHSQVSISQDAEITDYIQTIGDRLVGNSDLPTAQFHFFVVMDKDINAFAGPGGYIGVNSGLILTTEAESELASVMAHEIGHVTQRHLYRGAEAAGRLSIPTIAATLGAILLGTQSPALGQAALVAIQAGNVQFQINFTRQHEEEADRVGMQTLAASQFDPRGMPTFFERLQQSTRYYGKDVPEFLRTHPVTASRISDTRGRADTYPFKQYPDSLGYLLAKAKIYAQSATNPEDAQKYFQAQMKQGTVEQRAVSRYGLGLSLLNALKFKEAETVFQGLTKEYPNQMHYATALARVAFEAKNFPLALERFKKVTEQFPENESIKFEYISTLLKMNNAAEAKKLLLSMPAKSQQLPAFFELLAHVYSALKQPAESHRYLAEYYYAVGQTQDAILQIRLAKNSKRLNAPLDAVLSDRLNYFLDKAKEARESR